MRRGRRSRGVRVALALYLLQWALVWGCVGWTVVAFGWALTGADWLRVWPL